jgi:hypothetical protein
MAFAFELVSRGYVDCQVDCSRLALPAGGLPCTDAVPRWDTCARWRSFLKASKFAVPIGLRRSFAGLLLGSVPKCSTWNIFGTAPSLKSILVPQVVRMRVYRCRSHGSVCDGRTLGNFVWLRGTNSLARLARVANVASPRSAEGLSSPRTTSRTGARDPGWVRVQGGKIVANQTIARPQGTYPTQGQRVSHQRLSCSFARPFRAWALQKYFASGRCLGWHISEPLAPETRNLFAGE